MSPATAMASSLHCQTRATCNRHPSAGGQAFNTHRSFPYRQDSSSSHWVRRGDRAPSDLLPLQFHPPSSSGVNTVSGSLPKSSSSRFSDGGPAGPPLSADQSSDSGLVLTPLPSRQCRFLSWNRLEHCDITGDQLTCPRVREGPSEEELFQREGDQVFLENWWIRNRRRKGEGQRWRERRQENWKNCLELNLSYQDLGDPFQQENFLRILRQLICVEQLQLVDNSLTDLSSIHLPRCRILNLHHNQLACFRQLPKLPVVEHLCLSENAIGSLRGLGAFGNGPLRSLNLSRNPVTFTQDYRARVFSHLPKLEILDGIPKLPEDSSPTRLHFPDISRRCNIL